jgi:hypothetical protein
MATNRKSPKRRTASPKRRTASAIAVSHFRKTNPTKRKFIATPTPTGAIIQFGDYSTRIYEVDKNNKVKLVGSN